MTASYDAPAPGVHASPAHPARTTGGHLESAPRVEVGPDGCRACLDLPAQEGACATARTTVRQLLRAWEVVDDERAHDVLLVVSELVGNAVRHGGVPLALDLALDGDVLVVGVSDTSPGLPQQRSAAGEEEGGRGLTIVAALAQDWGVDPGDDVGKRVWARMTVDPGPG